MLKMNTTMKTNMNIKDDNEENEDREDEHDGQMMT